MLFSKRPTTSTAIVADDRSDPRLKRHITLGILVIVVMLFPP